MIFQSRKKVNIVLFCNKRLYFYSYYCYSFTPVILVVFECAPAVIGTIYSEGKIL